MDVSENGGARPRAVAGKGGPAGLAALALLLALACAAPAALAGCVGLPGGERWTASAPDQEQETPSIVPEEERVQPEGTVAYVTPLFLMSRSGKTAEEMAEKGPYDSGGYANADGTVTIYYTPEQLAERLEASKEYLASYIEDAARDGVDAQVSEDWTELVFTAKPSENPSDFVTHVVFVEANAGACQMYSGDGSGDFRIDVTWVNGDTGEVVAHYDEGGFQGSIDMDWLTEGRR